MKFDVIKVSLRQFLRKCFQGTFTNADTSLFKIYTKLIYAGISTEGPGIQ